MALQRKYVAIAGAVVMLALAGAAPALAQGFFESLFGGLSRATRHAPAGITNALDNMLHTIEPGTPRGEGGPRLAYCVRTCDGHYFPVHAHAGLSAAQACKSFCPASETRLYTGSGIDHSVATDGSRYADLPHAFAYRQKLVSGCTCNGRDAFGLAKIDPASDPTLQRGDIVVTKNGLVAVNERTPAGAQFTPVESYRGLPDGERKRLAGLRVSPSPSASSAQAETTGAAPHEDEPQEKNDDGKKSERRSWFSFTLGCGNLNGCR